MDWQEWEFLEKEVANENYSIVDPGPLFGPVTSFVIRRDRRLRLSLETTSEADSQAATVERQANEVYRLDDEVHLQSRHGPASVVVRGVGSLETTTSFSEADGDKKVQRSSISSIIWTSGEFGEPAYTMEWIENLSNRFLWPDSDHIEGSVVRTRTLGSPKGSVVIPSAIPSNHYGNSAVRIEVDGLSVFVGVSFSKPKHVKRPGFILYLGVPSDEKREKIRQCLSFCFGDYLLSLGCTRFNDKWIPVEFKAVNPAFLADEATRISGCPPAPLGMCYEFEIDRSRLNEMVSRLYAVYDEYNFRLIFWSYWHALSAPVHMAAAHFGAAFEALQGAYFNRAEAKSSNRLIEKQQWRPVEAQLIDLINGANFSEDVREAFVNKLKQLNVAPQSVLSRRFLSALGLEVSAPETAVWKNRNDAAHGKGVDEERVIQLIRENKILKVLINRIILCVSGASDHYYDYYTIGRPTRALREPIPADNPSVK